MKRILIVEDETAIREFEAINLKRVGYTVVEAGSGEEALEIYDSDAEGFDIALLDISMPGMDGFTLCKELRKRSETLGIIMLTARTQEMDKISWLMLGAAYSEGGGTGGRYNPRRVCFESAPQNALKKRKKYRAYAG